MDSDGVKINPKKLSAIIEMKAPFNVTEVRCLLAVINQLAKFSPRLPEFSALIRKLLHKNTSWIWASPQAEVFKQIKGPFALRQHLRYTTHKPTLVCTNALSF